METMLLSDHIVDFGPGAGKLGGEVVSTGAPDEVKEDERLGYGALFGWNVKNRGSRNDDDWEKENGLRFH